MSKSNDNGRPKRSRNYRPYDANDSFIRKITQRVTDIIPRPSWVSRWIGSDSSNADPRINSSDEDEEDSGGGGTAVASTSTTPAPFVANRPQPNKRIRLTNVNSTEDDRYLPRHNHVQRLAGEVSPIFPPLLRVVSKDRSEAGPSGIQNFRLDPKFVSSTPAIPDFKPRDNLSETSESTSGCSSLVPQGERRGSVAESNSTRRVTAEPRRLNSTASNISNISLGSRNLTLKQKCPTNLSTSFSTPKPAFDSYVFNNPLSRSSNSLDESSPFHRGRTLYGGASGYRRTLDETMVSPLTMAAAATSSSRISPKVISVQPAASLGTGSHVSSSALRIFKALEQFSSPVHDTKKIPLKSDGERRKRKAIRPFEELVLPEMPDLLRIKRKEDKTADSSTPASNPSTSTCQLPPPIQQLPHRSEDSVASDNRHVGSVTRRNKDAFDNDKVEEVNLPKVELPITTLPKFTFSLPKGPLLPPSSQQASASPSAITPTDKIAQTTSSTPLSRLKPSPPATAPLSKVPETSPAPTRTAQFTFSNALDDSKIHHPAKLPTTTSKFKFCEPSPAKSSKDETTRDLMKLPVAVVPQLFSSPITFPSTKSTPKAKKDERESSPFVLKTRPDPSVGSIDDFFKKDKSAPKQSDPTTKEKSRPPLFENGDLSAFKPKTDTWECKECFVRNASTRDKCEACGSKPMPKSNAVPATAQPINSSQSSLNALFKKPEGSWECKECFVSNKSDVASCVACGTSKTGGTSGASTNPLSGGFQFGMPASATSEATTSSSEKKSFTFGIPFGASKEPVVNDSGVKSDASRAGGFSFGVVSQENDVNETKSPALESEESLKVKKRVSFSEPPAVQFEDRSMSVEDSSMPPVTEPSVSHLAPEKTASAAFLFSSSGGTTIGKTSSFAPSSSTDSPASNAVSSSIFKFGNSSTGVSSSTDAAEPEKKGGFTFIPNNTSANSAPAVAPVASATWGTAGSSKVPFTAPVFPAKVDQAKNGASSTSETSGGILLGAKRENPFGSVFGAEKKSLFDSTGTERSQPSFNNVEERKNKPLFNSVVNASPIFGSGASQVAPVPAAAPPAKPFTFGAASPFSTEAPDKPPTNAFTFGSSSVNAAAIPPNNNSNSASLSTDTPAGNLFGMSAFQPAQDATAPALVSQQPPTADRSSASTFGSGSLFGRAATNKSMPIFGGSTGGASSAPSAAATPFTFGAPAAPPSVETQPQTNPVQQVPQAPSLFSFSYHQQPSASPFTFGATQQNSVPIHAPPTFDPNVKPNFNFSGGSTPTFSAMPTGNPPDLRTLPERRIRKAFRRTTQPR